MRITDDIHYGQKKWEMTANSLPVHCTEDLILSERTRGNNNILTCWIRCSSMMGINTSKQKSWTVETGVTKGSDDWTCFT